MSKMNINKSSDATTKTVSGAVVETSGGKLRGMVHNGIHAFKGIPYGAPTGGNMRFMPPGKPNPWSSVRDAFKFGHQSPQNMRYTDVLAPQADASSRVTMKTVCTSMCGPLVPTQVRSGR